MTLSQVTNKAQKAHIEKVLTEQDYNLSKSAKILDISRPILYTKIIDLKINVPNRKITYRNYTKK